MANEMNLLTVDIGAYTGATMHPLVKFPEGYGKITLKEVAIVGSGAGTSIGLILTTATDVGTPAVSGTLAAFAGTITYAEGVAFAATISTAAVNPGTAGIWLAVDQASGTAPANTLLTLAYVEGV